MQFVYKLLKLTSLVIGVTLTATTPALAQEQDGTATRPDQTESNEKRLTSTPTSKPASQAGQRGTPGSLDKLAIELLNPITTLRSITTEYLYQPFQGDMPNASDQAAQLFTFTGALPFRVRGNRSFMLRASLPLKYSEPTYRYPGNRRDFTEWRIRQEASAIRRDGDFFYVHGHLYDISFDIAYGGEDDNGYFAMVGIAGALPTSEDLSGARRQFLLGPELAAGKKFGRGIVGGWLSHLTNVANETSNPIHTNHDTNLTDLKLFYAYGIGNGWQIVSNSHITYDWEGEKDNKLLLPLGAGFAKTTRIGSMPVRLVFEAHGYLETPEAFGPDWQLKFSVAAVDMKRSR